MSSWSDTQYSSIGTSLTANTVNGVSIDHRRRIFGFGDRIAEIEPMQSLFFSYLTKMRKEFTDDSIFKMLELRHQWQRRNFSMTAAVTPGAETIGTPCAAGDDFYISCYYDKYGRPTTTENPCYFILPGQIIAIKTDGGDVRRFRILSTATVEVQAGTATSGAYITHDTSNLYTLIAGECLIPVNTIAATDVFGDGNDGQVIGSAFGEATGAPEGFKDEMYDREGYTQIFKTSIPMFSGTSRATRYRGVANEFLRVWKEKLKEHKMDLEQACLFGTGAAGGGSAVQYTWGILPYTESYGNIYSFNYADFSYDSFLDAMEAYFAPESGNSQDKLVLASRKVLNKMNKLGESGFLNNTVGSSSYRLDVQNVAGQFGHNVTKVNTIFGNLHFVQSPLLRGAWEDYAIAVDLKNVSWRPLKANGINRDTFITTNVQEADIDGRKDLITTEAGLQINLPETHAVFKWS